jgi:hypothetical protein
VWKLTKVRIHAGAADELEQAVLWYEKESPNLGLKFAEAFENALQLLREEHPPLVNVPGEAGSLGAKRLLLYRFPFSVVVYKYHDELIVIALAHHSRRPGYWKDRFHT